MIIEQVNFGKTTYMKVGDDGERESISQKEIDSYKKNPFRKKETETDNIFNNHLKTFYVTKKGNAISNTNIYEKVEEVLALPYKTKFKLIGIILTNTIKYTKNNKPYRRIKIEYRDETKTHNVFNEEIRHGKYSVCIFTGNVDTYKGQVELRIGSGELLMSKDEFKKIL